MQQEVEKLARQIIIEHAVDIEYLSIVEGVADLYPGHNLSEVEFEELVRQVDDKIREAKVIVKFGR